MKTELRPLIRDSLQILSFIGLNPFNSSFLASILKIIGTTFVTYSLIDSVIYLSRYYDGVNSAIDVTFFVGITQANSKLFLLLFNQKNIKLLVGKTNLFWKLNGEKKSEKTISFVRYCIRFITVLLIITCSTYFLVPFFTVTPDSLPWSSNCSQFFSYSFCYCLEGLQTFAIVSLQVGSEALFISLITNIICEFRFLGQRFRSLQIDSTIPTTDKRLMKNLSNLIEHHNLVLNCIHKMKRIYSLPFLVLFILNMFAMCFSLLNITSNEADSATKILFILTLIFYIVQLFFYCIAGSLLTAESVEISNMVYDSDWWAKTQPELRKSLTMIIRRGNLPESLTAGAILEVNLETFTKILRSTLSFFTFIQVIYSD